MLVGCRWLVPVSISLLGQLSLLLLVLSSLQVPAGSRMIFLSMTVAFRDTLVNCLKIY